jgi:hypothetical protein
MQRQWNAQGTTTLNDSPIPEEGSQSQGRTGKPSLSTSLPKEEKLEGNSMVNGHVTIIFKATSACSIVPGTFFRHRANKAGRYGQ